MKHEAMVKLMGRMVLVSKVLKRQKAYPTRMQKVTVPGPFGAPFEADVPTSGGMRAWWTEETLEKPRTGWVVGFRTLQEGYVEPEGGGRSVYGEPDYEPAEWRTKGTKKCLLVAFWPTEKPVHVPLDGYTRVSRGGRYIVHLDPGWIMKGVRMEKAPEPYTTAGGWQKETYRLHARAFMTDEMKNWPRDKKGHWKKKEK